MTTKVHHVTVGFPHAALMDALATAANFEGFISASIPDKWPYPRIATIDKFRLLSGYFAIHGLRDHDIVLFTDAYDVLVLQSAHEMTRRFVKTGSALVFNAETNLFPSAGRDSLRTAFDSHASNASRYLNSGCYVGYVWAVRAMLDWCLARAATRSPRDHALDQELAQDYWLHQLTAAPGMVGLDISADIFATLMKQEETFVLSHGRVVRDGQDCCILHANGDKRNLAILDRLFELLYPKDGRKVYIDLRLITADGKPVSYNAEHFRIEMAEAPSEWSVFLLSLGGRFSIALTAKTGPLTFHPSGAITYGAPVMAEWEVLLGVENPQTMHRYALSDRLGAALHPAFVPLNLLSLPWARDLVGVIQWIDQAAIVPAFGDGSGLL